MAVSEALAKILTEYGRDPAFCTCDCPRCYQTRHVEKKVTAAQALHTIMGATLADSIIDDMGPHWAIVAALCDPRGDGTKARAALVAISEAGVEFERRKKPSQA